MVETNRTAFDIIRQARRYDRFSYSFNGPQAFDQFSEDIGRLRRTARWIGINLYLVSAEEDSVEVVESILDMLHLCYSMDQDSSVLAQIVRMSILALAQGSIEEVLSRMSLSDESLIILSDAVRQSMRPHVLASALEVEASLIANATGQPDVRVAQVAYDEAKINRWMREMEKQGFTVSPTSRWYGPTGRWQHAYRKVCPGSQQLIDAQVVKFNLSMADTLRASGTIDYDLIRDAAEDGVENASGLAGSHQNLLKNDASLLSLIYALEAERFRLKMGRWPNDFAELLDGDPVPVDPWNQPLRLLHTDQGIRVYSVGVNAI